MSAGCAIPYRCAASISAVNLSNLTIILYTLLHRSIDTYEFGFPYFPWAPSLPPESKTSASSTPVSPPHHPRCCLVVLQRLRPRHEDAHQGRRERTAQPGPPCPSPTALHRFSHGPPYLCSCVQDAGVDLDECVLGVCELLVHDPLQPGMSYSTENVMVKRAPNNLARLFLWLCARYVIIN